MREKEKNLLVNTSLVLHCIIHEGPHKTQDSQTYIKGKERPTGRAKKKLGLVYPSKWYFFPAIVGGALSRSGQNGVSVSINQQQ